ncbi:hypothetical protein U14_01811 [Candidatus Moduliflexus flocculans]|uniref:SGNH/GDSL hydrolase family protein n=1 Tax=Candidatus Moduliflexus flocculans TaxID=1499966 RepID=A0A0S6VT41_9BACT|nr:hypothetical protein U14_01811 [Candidatus Moduliflexus flocculans]
MQFSLSIYLAILGWGGLVVGILLNEWIVAKIWNIYDLSAQIIVWGGTVISILAGAVLIKVRHQISAHIILQSALIIGVLSIFPLIEGGLRISGYPIWSGGTPPLPFKVEPGNKLYTTDEHVGFRLLPGKFTVTLPDGYSFHMTHLPDTLRITHPLETYHFPSQKKEIWIFGCSFTYGWALNDEETYPWLLQERFENYEIVNFGVMGYGILQSYLQLQEALKSRDSKPQIVIINYASFHDERNILPRSRQKILKITNYLGPIIHPPYADIDQNGRLSYTTTPIEYHPLPLMKYSAFLNLLDDGYNRIENMCYDQRGISKAILQEFFNLAKQNQIEMIVAGIYADSKTKEMLTDCQRIGMKSVDISVDLKMPHYIMLPHDNHPSPLANQEYAKKLEQFLREQMHLVTF